LTPIPHGGHNEQMTSPQTTKPFQFRLRSIFLATAAVGVTLGLWKCLGTHDFLTAVFLTAPLAATVVVMVKVKGGWASLWAWFLLVLVVYVIILLLSPFIDTRF
jgi:hypothetical protein